MTGIYQTLDFNKHGPYRITEVFANGTVRVQRGQVNERIDIIQLEFFELDRLGTGYLGHTRGSQGQGRVFILNFDTRIMILSCSYLRPSGDTVLILNLQFETKSGRKYWETIYKGNMIQDSLKGI